MAVFKVETKNKVDIVKKPRVYFTCHPNDFEKHFKKVCEDIFKTHDCAIYYTEDMTEVIAEDEKQVDLGRHNLFVIPVTFNLLTTPNRAMDEDIPYALAEHIPVLPIMMESGIDELYSKPDKFGELQYLNPYSTDLTEISYEEKLKKYLESVLIGDEMTKRIRAAFDAYIFLSYRKKDRKYANELMRLIHSNPECRDIAIWFDEFLTPGENFRESIAEILSDSKLFTLLVTPNLLEEPNGKPNFVMAEEYPAAKKSGIDILPAEMETIDKDKLEEKFEGIPACVDPHQEEDFKERLLETVTKLAVQSNNTPEHNFLIGLAYLEGIDVEVDRKRALELITSAAEKDLVEAAKKLVNMYENGIGVERNYLAAAKMQGRVVSIYEDVYAGDSCYENLNNLIWALFHCGDKYKSIGLLTAAKEKYQKALAILEKSCMQDDTRYLRDLSVSCERLGDILQAEGSLLKAKDYYKKGLEISQKLADETHTVESYDDLAISYYKLSLVDTARKSELLDQAISIYEMLKENCPNVPRFRNNLNVLKSLKK